MKSKTLWVAGALVLALIGAAVTLRGWSARSDRQLPASAASASRIQAVVELAADDVLRAEVRELARGLAISGALKAVDTAVVKARVAGELQGMTLREGDTVQANQIVARIDSSEYQARVKQAQEQADAARAQIDIAQRQYDNNKALVDQGFISRTALDTSQANLNAAQATYKAAMAAVDVARKSLDDTVLRSPIAGQVSVRSAQPGERVGVDARVLEVVDPRRLELEASLSPADSIAVRVGQVATLVIEGSAAADSSRQVKARVVRINPSAQPGSRSVLVYLALESNASLRQGLFAQGTLDTGRSSALTVPLTAVRTDKPSPYVQVVDQGRIAHRTVTLGERGEIGSETHVVVSGLDAGAQVIRGTLGTLREGTAVTFTPQRPAATASTPARP